MKASIFCARMFMLLAAVASFTLSAFSQTPDLKNDLRSSFTKVDVVRIDAGGELRTEGVNKTLTVQTEGRTFQLVVEPNNILSSRYKAENSNAIGMVPVERPTVQTYKGAIAGAPNSEVRLTIEGVKVEGFFQDVTGRRFIEPASRYSTLAGRGDSVIYRAEDSLKDNSFFCEADLSAKLEIGREVADAGRTESASMLRVLELATEADLEYVNALGGPAPANNEIVSILNMVEGTYTGELNLSIRVVYQHTWTAADPFGAVNMNGILTAFQNHWNANFGNIARDAAHLFTGKAPAASQGLAYLGVICRAPTFSYGLSSHISWAPGKFLIPAHELGHNLGADHVDATQGCANTLMNPGLTNLTPLSFCTFSRDAITAYVSANSSCLTEATVPTGTAQFDFDGDGRSDISVFRPLNGAWYLNRSTAGFTSFQFGLSGDKPVASDYDGDGKADAAVYRAGVWYRLRSASNTVDAISFGLATDLPVPSDFDGDSKADVVVFRPSNGVWYSLASSNGAFASTRFGLAGDVPVPGDYDADGKDDINLFRPSNGAWYRLNSSNGSFTATSFGLPGDKAVAGDLDGDGRADITVWRPSNGAWYSMRSTAGFYAVSFGLAGDIPVAGDYDGDGKTDVSVFRPSNGTWYRLNSTDGSFGAVGFGLATDIAVPSFYVQ